ncbi:hypothetical protein WJX77_001518 [Trebouxia sp. C0004]
MLVQGLLHTSKDNKENVDPEKDFQAQIMGSSDTLNALPATDALSTVQTTEALVLRDMFPSRSSLLQYVNGMLCSDGSVGMFDGDGGITVPHNDKAGRSRLELNITQEKCPAVLKAIQALYPGTLVHNPHRLKWVAADIIPAVYKALGSNLILRRQKLNTLLTHLFKVDTTKDPIVVNPNPRVSEVMT